MNSHVATIFDACFLQLEGSLLIVIECRWTTSVLGKSADNSSGYKETDDGEPVLQVSSPHGRLDPAPCRREAVFYVRVGSIILRFGHAEPIAGVVLQDRFDAVELLLRRGEKLDTLRLELIVCLAAIAGLEHASVQLALRQKLA